MSERPRFSLTKKIREIKLSIYGDESCNNCALETGEEYDPKFAHFYEQIKRNGQRRSSRPRNMFNASDLDVSFNSLDSDESTVEEGSKLMLNENPLSPSKTQILVNIDDEYSGDQCANSNSEALSGEELANGDIEAEKSPKKKRQTEIEMLQTSIAENLKGKDGIDNRKSKRTRIKPCDYWRLQRPRYVRDSTGLSWVINGVEEGSEELTATFKVQPKKKAKKRLQKEEANHEYSFHVTKGKLARNESRKKKLLESNLLVDKASLEWKASSSSGDGIQMALIQKDVNKEEAWGLLKIAGLSKKLPQETGDYTTHFTILQGNVFVAIGNLSAILDNSSIFEIPPNTIYSLENVRRDESLLQFIVKKRT